MLRLASKRREAYRSVFTGSV